MADLGAADIAGMLSMKGGGWGCLRSDPGHQPRSGHAGLSEYAESSLDSTPKGSGASVKGFQQGI